MSRVVVNGGRIVSHQDQTAPHKLFAGSAQNIAWRPMSKAGFEKTPDLVVRANQQNSAVNAPHLQGLFATNRSYYKSSEELFVNQAVKGLRASRTGRDG